jgi:hypothetical protein
MSRTRQAFDAALVELGRLQARITELEALLNNYRGECRNCGREGVLLDYISTYDGMDEICLFDKDECERLHEERTRREGEEFRARVAAGDPMAVMADNFGRMMLNSTRKSLEFKPGGRVEWTVQPATYGSFITSNTSEDEEK